MDEVKQHHEITLGIFPFENLSDGDQGEIFCRSLHMDLVTELSRFRQFRIITCRSPEDAQAAGTNYTINGSFNHGDSRLKITAQLINHQAHHVAWADRFEGPQDSLLSIQEDLLKEVVATLQQQLHYDLLSQIRRKTRTNLTAYEHWLYGMEELKKGSLDADERARAYFQRAIDIDPNYSLAYSGMSLTYFNEWSCQLWDRWDVCQKGAFDWAKKAIELDEQNYVAACVLGRVYLYEGEYEIAEHYLRRALRLNSNDIDNLVQIASCFVFLGYVDEAAGLYQEVIQRTPLHTGAHLHIAALIAFESGRYDECIAHGVNARTAWVDFPAIMAAAYYHLGDLEKMHNTWQRFLRDFQLKILKSEEGGNAEAVQWLLNVNPYKENTNLLPFARFISGADVTIASRAYSKMAGENHPNFFLKENDRWQIAYDGKLVHLREVKGFYDLARMLENPEKLFHCTELSGGGLIVTPEPVFDEKARRSYEKKLRDLQEEIRWSERNHDLERTSILQKEYDEILDHLTSSLGIGRKARKVNDPVDKARSAATWRIRKAIRKIQEAHAALGRHLSLSVKTGVFCSYVPEKPVRWVSDSSVPSKQKTTLTM